MNTRGNLSRQGQAQQYQRKEAVIDTTSTRAKKRWKAVLGRITAGYHAATQPHEEFNNENLIEEIKRMKKKKQTRARGRTKAGGVLHILHSYYDEGNTGLERQKYSAKERVMRKRASGKSVLSMAYATSLQDYDNEARLRYPITSEIRIKLERIKRGLESEHEKRQKEEEEGTKNVFKLCFQKLIKWVATTNLGETVLANHRFYKLDPHEHLPELCRRCRRPLAVTLEARFTSIGILFCIFMPVIGFLLLYANREFYCVVCEELYVYGDLTARVEELGESEGDDE